MPEDERQGEQLEGLCPHGNLPDSCELCQEGAGVESPSVEESAEQAETRTKEQAQQELMEKFGMRDTADFRRTLEAGDVDKAREWLQYIIDNQDRFPQYQETWGNWLADRQQEISQQELVEQFGMRKTADFRKALEEGRIAEAKAWLEHITASRDKFSQYNDAWFADRQAELERAER